MARGKAGGDLPRAKEATPKDPVKVLICDASSVVRRGIAQMLGTDDAILVVAEVGAADSVLPLVQDSVIDIVIGDPHQLSAEVITRVLDAGTRVLVVSFTVDERHLFHAIDSGSLDMSTSASSARPTGRGSSGSPPRATVCSPMRPSSCSAGLGEEAPP